MSSLKLNVCSVLRSPLNPRNWSGTPFHICTELERQDKLGAALTTKYRNPVIDLLTVAWYGTFQDLGRGALHRYYKSYLLDHKVKKLPSRHTLHMGTYDMPALSPDKENKHYLYVDSTWNLYSKYASIMKNYSGRLYRKGEMLEKKAYRQSTHIFPISEYVKQNLIEYYHIPEDKITVAGTGRGNIQAFHGEKDYANGKILFVAKGRFEDKGGNLVLKAFEIASRQNPGLQLTIVGQDKHKIMINQPNVTCLGFIPFEELQELFNTHSVFLMPALNEPWGLVYLEALACKMPIIGLNRNSFPEISGYGQYGYMLDDQLITKQNPEQLAEQLLKIIANPEELAMKGEAGQKFCMEKFSWENVVNTITGTIEERYLSGI